MAELAVSTKIGFKMSGVANHDSKKPYGFEEAIALDMVLEDLSGLGCACSILDPCTISLRVTDEWR